MLLSRFFTFTVLCASVVPALASPVVRDTTSDVVPLAFNDDEKAAFEHFNSEIAKVFQNLPQKEQDIIVSKTHELAQAMSPGPQLQARGWSKRAFAITSWEWLIETLGEDVLGAAVKNGHIKPPAAAGAVAADAAKDVGAAGSNYLAKFSGYGAAFALGVVVTSVLTGNGIPGLGSLSPTTTTVTPPAATTVFQLVKPARRELEDLD